jgi:hypothetical protein
VYLHIELSPLLLHHLAADNVAILLVFSHRADLFPVVETINPPLNYHPLRLNIHLHRYIFLDYSVTIFLLFSGQAPLSKSTPANSCFKEDPKYSQMYGSIYDIRNWEEEESKKMKNKLQLS